MDYTKFTEREWDIFYEALSLGQRMTGTFISQQLSGIELSNSELLKKKRLKSFGTYLANISTITPEQAKELYKDTIK